MRAISSFSFEDGISTRSCNALLALRMRVSMSATGSVSIASSYQELFVMPGITPWWASSRRQIRQSPNFLNTARGRPHLLQRLYARVLNFCGRAALAIKLFLATLLLGRERKAQAAQQRLCLLVRLGGGRDRDVEAADLVDAVVVDLREDDLLAQAQRLVAAPVERVRVQPSEVADPRQCDRDQAIDELPHAVAAQRHARADRHPLADLELRDRLLRAAHLRV